MRTRSKLIKSFIMRHRMSLQDGALVAAALAVTAYVLLSVDVFVAPGAAALPNTIEPDELPLLGAVLAIGILFFAWRRMRQQKRETTVRLEAQAQLSKMAFQDALTGLPNRRSLLESLRIAVASPPAAGAVHALIMLDLNGFKRINDVFGHAAGDQVLIGVGQRLLLAVREGDLVARLGGDEFAVVATQLPSRESATSLALRILDNLSRPISANNIDHHIGAGLGICLIPLDAAAPDEALRRADVALYKAKAAGKSALRFFDQAMDQHVRERAMLEREFRKAFADGQIKPFFQPLIDLQSNAIVGFEALARWHHESLGQIAPDRFIAIAEDSGMIGAVTDHLLRLSCEAACDWPAHIFLSFNISAIELRDRTLSPRILAILKAAGFDPRRLEIEITESALVRDLDTVKEVLRELREMGVSIALDDFGTGYSSLYHLRNFKVDKIKIDRSFIHDMGDEHESAEIVAALIGLGRGLGLTITAEGIERSSEETKLLGLGCQQGQGYLFSKAVCADDAKALFQQALVQPAASEMITYALNTSQPGLADLGALTPSDS